MNLSLLTLATLVLLLNQIIATSLPAELPTIDEAEPEEPQPARLRDRKQRSFRKDPPEVKVYLNTPYRLRDPDALPTVTPKNLRFDLPKWLRKWRAPSSFFEPPSSNEDMERLLETRPYRVFRTAELLAITESSPIVHGHQVIQLVGGNLDREVMTMMTRKGNPFYVQGRQGKIWHFTKSGRDSFTYTNTIKEEDLARVKEVLGGTSSSNQAWWRSLSGRTRRKFGTTFASLRSFHGL